MPELHQGAVQTAAPKRRRFRTGSLGIRKLCSHSAALQDRGAVSLAKREGDGAGVWLRVRQDCVLLLPGEAAAGLPLVMANQWNRNLPACCH